MKKRNSFLLTLLTVFALAFLIVYLKKQTVIQEQANWQTLIHNPDVPFQKIKEAFEKEWKGKPYQSGHGYKAFKRYEAIAAPRLNEEGIYDLSAQNESFEKYLKEIKNMPASMLANNDNWTELGPTSPPGQAAASVGEGSVGRIDVIAFHPTDANTYWVGTPTGGLWKTTNDGASWSSQSDNWTCLGVSDIAIDPTNPNVMYVATGDRDAGRTPSFGIRKSIDGGNTWTTLPQLTDKRFYRLLINPTNTQIIIAATNDGIYHSTNGGNTFTQAIGIGGVIWDMEFLPSSPNVVFAVTNDGLFTSTNDAAHFANTIPLAVSRTALAVHNNEHIYIMAAKQNGNSFEQLYVFNRAVGSFDSNNKTLDLGNQSSYDWSLAVSPSNPNEVYVGGVPFKKSTDGGKTFTDIPGIHVDIHAIEYHPITGKVFVGSDGGLNREPASGTTWDRLMNGLGIMQMYKLGGIPSDPTRVLTGVQDNGTNLYNNGAWTFQQSGDGAEVLIDPVNPNIMYGVVNFGKVIKTTNGGVSWKTILDETMTGNQTNSLGNWGPIMHPDNRKIIFVGLGDIWKSIDQGETFTNLTNGNVGPVNMNINDIEIAPNNPNIIYVAKGGDIYKSTDGGTTWATVTPPSVGNGVRDMTLDPTDDRRIFVITTDSKVMFSLDRGIIWNGFSVGLPANISFNSLVYREGSVDEFYLGTDKGVYYKDGVANWVPYFNNLPNVIVNELEINGCNNKIRAATYGRGLWESPLENIANTCCPSVATINTPASTCAPVTLTAGVAPTDYTYQWYKEGNPISGANSQTYMASSGGEYTVQYRAPSSIFGGVPNRLASCHSSTSIGIKVITCQSVPFNDDIEATGINNAWTINDPDGFGTFEQGTVSGCANNGTKAFKYPGDEGGCVANQTIGPNDNFVGCFDLTGSTTAKLNFDLSLPTPFSMNDPTYRLKVEVSTNCGMSYNEVYNKSNADLITSTSMASPFTPTSCADWRNEEVCLDAYAGNEVLIRFTVEWMHTGACNPNLYLDNFAVNKGTSSCGCPTLTAAPTALSIASESTCGTGCMPQGGSWSLASTPCSTGSSLQSFASATATTGGTAMTAAPMYNPTTAETFHVRCVCDTDNTKISPVQTISSNPGACTIPIATPSNNGPVCTGTTLSLTGAPSGMTSYAWTGPNNFMSALQNPTVSMNASTAMAGVYTLTVTDANGCTDTKTTTVTVNTAPEAIIIANASDICTGSDVSINLSAPLTLPKGNYTITYNVNGGTSMDKTIPMEKGIGDLTLSGLAIGNRTINITKITNASNCMTTLNGINTSIEVKDVPTTAMAGADASACGTMFTLQGNTPTVGTGQWTISDNPNNSGNLSNATSPNAILTYNVPFVDPFFNPLIPPQTFKATWTISNYPCPASSDEVAITFLPPPNAGPDVLDICGTTHTLAALIPHGSSGNWSFVSRSPAGTGNLSDPNTSQTTLTGVFGGEYVLRWTVTSGGGVCNNSFDEVKITFSPDEDLPGGQPDGIQDCVDLCLGGDDRINSDGVGIPDACDCLPNSTNNEIVSISAADFTAFVTVEILLGNQMVTRRADFELSTTAVIEAKASNYPSVTFKAGNKIILEKGFHAKLGSDFLAALEYCRDPLTGIVNPLIADTETPIQQSIHQPSSTEVSEQLGMQVYPNPITQQAAIALTLPQEGNISITLYNQQGRQVKTYTNRQFHPSGRHYYQIDATNLAAGFYFLQLWSEKGVITEKLIIQKK